MDAKYGIYGVFDLAVFDESGNKVAVLDTLKDSFIDLNEGAFGIVFVKDALLNTEFMKFVSKVEDDARTDFEKILNGSKKKNTFIVNGHSAQKNCKLIARCHYRHGDSGKDQVVLYEIPEAIWVRNYKFSHSNSQSGCFDYVFELVPYNPEGDVMKIHIEEN